jgi:hypothetical protein
VLIADGEDAFATALTFVAPPKVRLRWTASDLLARQMLCAVFFSIRRHAKIGVGVRGFGDAAGLAAMKSRRTVLGSFKFCAALLSPFRANASRTTVKAIVAQAVTTIILRAGNQ